MDTDNTASREQGTAQEPDTALEDIRVLFKDSLDKPIIRCWNEAEICEIIHDNHETVQLVSREDFKGNRYTATISRRLLTRISLYFKALLEGGFSERTKKVLSIDCHDFFLESLKDWLCTGELSLLEKWGHLKTGFYLFADFYEIPALRRAIMTAAVARSYDKPWHPIVADEDDYHERFTRQFWFLVSKGHFNKSADKPCRCCHNPCDYHEHESEEEWKNTCHLTNPEFPKPDPSTYRSHQDVRERYGMDRSV